MELSIGLRTAALTDGTGGRTGLMYDQCFRTVAVMPASAPAGQTAPSSIHFLSTAICSAPSGEPPSGIRSARSDETTRWNSGLAAALPAITTAPDLPPLVIPAGESWLNPPAGCAPL